MGNPVQNSRDQYQQVLKLLLHDLGDQHDKDLVEGEAVDFIWAHGKTEANQTVSNHGNVNRGSVVLNFTDDGGSNDVIIVDGDNTYYFHKWTNFVCWGIASDVAIIVGRYYKTWGYRTYLHGFLFILIVTSSITTALMMLSTDWTVLEWINFKEQSIKNKFHIIIFMLVAILMIAQSIGGIIYNYMLSSLKVNQQVSVKPSIHAIMGSVVYTLGKLQIIAGLFMDNDVRLMLILGAVFTTRLILEILYQKGSLVNVIMTGKDSNSSKVYDDGYNPLLEINNSNSDDNFEKNSSKLWCIYKNQVVDLSQMIHPGGNYIWKLIQGQDVTRYILGAYTLDSLKIKTHKHSIYTLKILEQYTTGIYVNSDLEFFVNTANHRVVKQLRETWKLNTICPYTDQIAYFGFINEKYQFKNTLPGLQTFGQYFVIKSIEDDEISTRQYTMVLSMTYQRTKFRKDLSDLFKKILSLQSIQKEIPKEEEYCSELPLIIKRYQTKSGLSSFIHEDNRNGQYQIEGPYGNNITIENGNHLVFIAGGTGLFPFLDILEYQLKLTYHKILLKQFGLEAAQIINTGVVKNFKITLFLAVNSAEDLIGKDIYFSLLSLQSQLDIPNFTMVVKGNFKLKECEIITQRFNAQVFKSSIGDLNSVTKYFICGPPTMNFTTEKILKEAGLKNITVL
ncbi:unnamed protein product (macronuclear) [Paramecium tetraurelia]|uniref:Uncharacterized protein n=1 Tax=Paramecium tetraurelia TaxID=5888 RepID=A0C120_PARTE|nr:uncharacterized protein GSPATT00033963001 [Paramecium tetraurelia]CAK64487.1 unnamed protein product [Paramecium tetraurelia]|eukprot:XP_001431885.1 hypothetical protein (macronuclear) [Paramecium tetraurelia strain d4-2]